MNIEGLPDQLQTTPKFGSKMPYDFSSPDPESLKLAKGERLLGLTFFLLSLGLLNACSTIQVSAWEKEHLADRAMTAVPDALDRRFIDHIYFSREASSGGFSIGGGGCGCN